jgi:hypothetical protein
MNNLPSQQQGGSNADAELVRALAAAGVPATQIAQIIQSRVAPAQPMEHRNAWFQVSEGTSPLSVYTGMFGETRQSATPKTLHVQTFEASSSNKLSLKLTVWPAAKPESVAVHQFRNLGEDWKRALVELNARLIQITPPADRGLVPSIPLDVDGFLDHCYTSLRTYDPVTVLRAWEAAHLFVVDEYITKRSKPELEHGMVVACVSSRAFERWSRSGSGRVGRSSVLRQLEFSARNKVQIGAKRGLSQDSQVRALRRSSSCHQVRLSGLSPGGSWKFGPELASSRPIRPRSVCLGASAPIRLTRRVPESFLATISQSARPSPLNPDVWNRVLSEAGSARQRDHCGGPASWCAFVTGGRPVPGCSCA